MRTNEEILKTFMECLAQDMEANRESNLAVVVIVEILLDIRALLTDKK